MATTKHCNGCYRVRLDSNGEQFGQVRKNGKWRAEIRDVGTGDFIRPAGIWDTRRDAVEEIESILERGA